MKKTVVMSLWLMVLMCLSFTPVSVNAEESVKETPPNIEVASAIVPLAVVAQTVPSNIIEATPTEAVEIPTAEIVPREDPAEPVVQELAVPHTEEDVYLLAQLMNSEAGSESMQCQAYVASVVLNRMASSEFPNTLSGVVFDRNCGVQFSVTLRNKKGHRPIDNTPSAEQIELARSILTNGSQLPSDVMVFYSVNCHSSWVRSRRVFKQVDHTIFSYIYK